MAAADRARRSGMRMIVQVLETGWADERRFAFARR
jgi:hypothetical protein